MKRLFALLAVMIMSVSFSLAETPDFSGMTQEQILDTINAGRNALVIEESEDCLLRYETGNGITIIFRGFSDRKASAGYSFMDVTIVNDTDTDYEFYCESLYINGWSVDTILAAHVKAHRRMNDEWGFRLGDANMTSVSEISEMEYELRIHPEGGRARDKLSIPTAIIIIK